MDKKKLQTDILEASFQPDQWLEVLRLYFGAKKFHQSPLPIILPNNDLAEMAAEIGSFYTADERLIGIYEVKLTAKAWISKNRVGLRNLLRHVYKYDVDGALIVFVQNSKWRFSYVSEIRTEEGKKETEPKRYTYLFGKGESCRTAAERFDKLQGKPIYLADLFDAFSVDKLNKDFFKSYKEFFEKFSAHLASEIKYRKLILGSSASLEKGWQDEAAKPIRDFSKKLLGRIVFLQFLQKKGWMGVASSNDKWIGGNTKFLQDLFLNYVDKEHFHSKSLRTLFFETLNKKRKNQIAPIELGKDIKVPYLNGGLFDKDISFENDIDFPADLFKNLLEFFESYNFTIDENDPYDSEVGIDPEMLGHIFENLLEENREKGAFYTPKEIVHYMCQESLIQYLRNHLPECTEDESPATKALENFIRNSITGERNDKKNFVVQQAKRIEKLLDKVKICDPAIGSGAFPMGMLQEIFKAKTALDLTLDHAEVKKQIIQESIYGVDVENGAVEIARLRFWLALVVDETEPQPLPNLDYKIMQGNSLLESFEGVNLKFERKKFEVKVEKQKNLFGEVNEPQMSLTDYLQGKQDSNEFDIVELEVKYFSSNDADEKELIRTKINKIEKDFISEQLEKKNYELKELIRSKESDYFMDIAQTTTEAMELKISNGKKARELEKIKIELQKAEESKRKLFSLKRHEKPYFLWSLYFMDVFEKGGFDIVIGNPPYVEFKTLEKDVKNQLEKKYKTTIGKYDLYIPFIEFPKEILKSEGLLIYICPTRFMHRDYGKSLREFIRDSYSINQIVDFGDGQIFENAMTYTGVFSFINGRQKESFPYIKFNSNQNLKDFESLVFNQVNKLVLEKDTWYFDNASNPLINKIQLKTVTLESISDGILQGIATGKDSVFIISEEDISENNLELGLLHKILKGKDISPYDIKWSNKYLIYTYEDDGTVIKEDKLKANYPNIFKYLLSKKNDLIGRDYFDKSNKSWYELWNQRNLTKYKVEKLITLDNASRNSFAYDESGFIGTTTTYSIIPKGINSKYLLGLLNSKLLTYYHFKNTIPQAGGFYRYQALFIKNLPIRISGSQEMQIISLVDKIILNRKNNLESSNYENKIDALVFHLYGLTEQEMSQVLDTFKDLSIKVRNQIQNEYWNIANNKFQLEK
jgi:hypothetical protein